MRIALFLTADLGPALEVLGTVRQRHPEAALTVFVRDDHRDDLAAALRGCDVRRDKPAGGRLAFVRALRKERFDLAVVAWHGGDRFHPLRLVALLSGARRVLAIDERGRERGVRWFAPQDWGGHLARRLMRLRAITVLRVAVRAYRLTIGALVAAVTLVPTLLGLWAGGQLGRKS